MDFKNKVVVITGGAQGFSTCFESLIVCRALGCLAHRAVFTVDDDSIELANLVEEQAGLATSSLNYILLSRSTNRAI